MIDGGFREAFHTIDCLANQSLPRDCYEIIWVEYYGYANPLIADRQDVRVITLNHFPDTMYHSSYCFNEGIRQSKGEIIAVLDADLVMGERFLETIIKEHDRYDDLAMYFLRLDQPEEKRTDNVSLSYLQNTCIIRVATNYGACLTVRKKWLLEINGYEQHRAFASGNHANGLEMYTRLRNLGLAIKWHPSERLYHPWHSGTSGRDADRSRVQWQQAIIKARDLGSIKRPYLGLAGEACLSSKPPSPPLGDPDNEPDNEPNNKINKQRENQPQLFKRLLNSTVKRLDRRTR